MEILINEKLNYQLIKDDSKYYLLVLCGTVGMFEINYVLSNEEIDNFHKSGKEYISYIAKNIRDNPNNYSIKIREF